MYRKSINKVLSLNLKQITSDTNNFSYNSIDLQWGKEINLILKKKIVVTLNNNVTLWE